MKGMGVGGEREEGGSERTKGEKYVTQIRKDER